MLTRFYGAAAIYLAANVASAAVPFLLLPVLTRVLSPADYGIVGMFGMVVTVLSAFTGLNVHAPIGVRAFQLEQPHFARYVSACLAILAASTVAVALVVAAASSVLETYTQIPAGWLFVAVFVAAAQVAINIRLTLWQVRHRAGSYGALQVSQSVLNAGLSLLFVLALGLTWTGRLLGQAIAVAIFLVAALALMRGHVARPISRDDMRDALKFGVPLIPHMLGAFMAAAADRLLIVNILGLEQAGLYVVALQIGTSVGLLTESFNKVYAPWLMSKLGVTDAERDRRIVLGTYLYFGVVSSMAIGLGFAAPYLLSVIVGKDFQGASDSIIYIAMGFAFSGMYYMVAGYVFFKSRTAQLALITLACGVFNVIATWILVHANGVVGAAQAFMLAQAALFVGTWCFAQRVRPMPWRRALLSPA